MDVLRLSKGPFFAWRADFSCILGLTFLSIDGLAGVFSGIAPAYGADVQSGLDNTMPRKESTRNEHSALDSFNIDDLNTSGIWAGGDQAEIENERNGIPSRGKRRVSLVGLSAFLFLLVLGAVGSLAALRFHEKRSRLHAREVYAKSKELLKRQQELREEIKMTNRLADTILIHVDEKKLGAQRAEAVDSLEKAVDCMKHVVVGKVGDIQSRCMYIKAVGKYLPSFPGEGILAELRDRLNRLLDFEPSHGIDEIMSKMKKEWGKDDVESVIIAQNIVLGSRQISGVVDNLDYLVTACLVAIRKVEESRATTPINETEESLLEKVSCTLTEMSSRTDALVNTATDLQEKTELLEPNVRVLAATIENFDRTQDESMAEVDKNRKAVEDLKVQLWNLRREADEFDSNYG